MHLYTKKLNIYKNKKLFVIEIKMFDKSEVLPISFVRFKQTTLHKSVNLLLGIKTYLTVKCLFFMTFDGAVNLEFIFRTDHLFLLYLH